MNRLFKILALLIVVTIILAGANRKEIEKTYYESGKVKTITCRYKKNMRKEITEYYENGNIKSYYNWIDDVLDGKAFTNYLNGQIETESFYSNGFKTGIWKYYEKNGDLGEEKIFEKNKTAWNSNLNSCRINYYEDRKLIYTEILFYGIIDKLIVSDSTTFNKKTEIKNDPLGKKLFLSNCSPCHSAKIDIVGPKLSGIGERRNDDWLIKMILNGNDLYKSGDKEAVELYGKWHNAEHPKFDFLKEEELKHILEYIKTF